MSQPLFFKWIAGTVRAMKDGVERSVHLSSGDPLPEGILPSEVEKLKGLGAVGPKADVKVVSAVEPEASTGPATDPSSEPEAVAKPPTLDLTGLDTNGVAKLITDEKPSAHALLDSVGTDKTLAGVVLDAERLATNGDPRKSLVTGLEKVIAAE